MCGFIVSSVHSGVGLYPECMLWFHLFAHPMVIEAQFIQTDISLLTSVSTSIQSYKLSRWWEEKKALAVNVNMGDGIPLLE